MLDVLAAASDCHLTGHLIFVLQTNRATNRIDMHYAGPDPCCGSFMGGSASCFVLKQVAAILTPSRVAPLSVASSVTGLLHVVPYLLPAAVPCLQHTAADLASQSVMSAAGTVACDAINSIASIAGILCVFHLAGTDADAAASPPTYDGDCAGW